MRRGLESAPQRNGWRRRAFGRCGAAAGIAALLLVASASPAAASVTIGETFDPAGAGGVLGGSGVTDLQSGSPGGQYTVPFVGVITSWSFQASASNVPSLKFKVGRSAGGDNFVILGEDGPRTPTASMLNTFPTQIPVQVGDVIGNYRVTGGLFARSAASVYSVQTLVGDPAPGATPTFSGPSPGLQLDLSARLDPTNRFTLGKTTRNKKKGTATLTVNVPNPGVLALSGNGVKTAAAGAVVAKTVTAAGAVELKVKAKGKKRKQLNETGKVKVKPKITFTPTSGDPSTQSRKLKLKKNT